MIIVFMGTPDFSVPILKALHETYGVALVVTQPDKPKGRKKITTPPPVKAMAETLGIKTLQPVKVKDSVDAILAYNPDIIITAAYGQILPNALLTTPTYKAINVHASLLPKLRGGAPIQRAIERGHTHTGVTVMTMHQKMDAGDILSQRAIPIEPTDTAGSVFEKLSILGRDLLLETLPSIVSNTIKPLTQNEEDVTYAYAIKRDEERLDFSKGCEVLERKVRAFHPAPNTYTTVDGKKLKVIQARIHQCKNFLANHSDAENGIIIKHFSDGFAVKTPTGALVLTEVQLEGKKPMDGETFLRGYKESLVKTGTVLGK